MLDGALDGAISLPDCLYDLYFIQSEFTYYLTDWSVFHP